MMAFGSALQTNGLGFARNDASGSVDCVHLKDTLGEIETDSGDRHDASSLQSCSAPLWHRGGSGSHPPHLLGMVDTFVAGSPKERRRYRRWSEEAKRTICLETRAPGVSVAQVAQRHALNANLIFKWLRDPRFAPGGMLEGAPVFLPVQDGVGQRWRINVDDALPERLCSAVSDLAFAERPGRDVRTA